MEADSRHDCDQDILNNIEDFQEHLMEYQENEPVNNVKKCYFCKDEFPNALKCYYHERFCKVNLSKRFTCQHCGLNFKNNLGLTHHEKRHVEPGDFLCFQCDTRFTSATARFEHKITQHPEFQCQICLEIKRSSEDYVLHILNSHSDSKNKIMIDNAEKQDKLMGIKLFSEEVALKTENIYLDDDMDTLNEPHSIDLPSPDADFVYDYFENEDDRSTMFAIQEIPQQSSGIASELKSNKGDGNRLICEICSQTFARKQLLICHMQKTHEAKRKRNICEKCGTKLKTESNFRRHKKLNCGKHAAYQCVLCKKGFSMKSYLIVHIMRYRDKKGPPYYCHSCKDSFKTMSARNVHIEKQHKRFIPKKHPCEHCGKLFVGVTKSFIRHMLNEHGIEMKPVRGRIMCKYCTSGFVTEEKLHKHIKFTHIVEGVAKTKCPDCGQYYDSYDEMLEHSRMVHKEKFTCDICNKVFKRMDTLTIHKNIKHTTGKSYARKKFLCKKCGKVFANTIAFKDHEQSDCGKNPQYQCDVCLKNFTTKGILKTHKRAHDNIKPFACAFCSKAFLTRIQMVEHERTHTGERPYKCPKCPKAFACGSTLRTHLSVHTGFKRYECSGCGQRFTCLSNMRVHRNSKSNKCHLVPNNTKPLRPMDGGFKN